jgi:plastocyanin
MKPGTIGKAFALLALAALAVAMVGCGSGGGDSSVTSTHASLDEEDFGNWSSSQARADSTFTEEHPGSAKYGSPPLELEADPGGDLSYTADEVTAKEGNVTIEFTNPQSTPHNVAVEALPKGWSVMTDTVKNGFSAVVVTLNTKEDFIFYCTVPGHRKAGMEGILRVKPRP